MIAFWRRFLNAFSSLKARLALVVAVSFTPAVLAVIHDHFTGQSHELTEATQHAELSVLLAAESYEGVFETARQVLIALSQVPSIRDGERADCNAVLAGFLKKYPRFLNISVSRTDGTLFASALPLKIPINIADRPHFKRALETRDFSIGDFTKKSFDGETNVDLRVSHFGKQRRDPSNSFRVPGPAIPFSSPGAQHFRYERTDEFD